MTDPHFGHAHGLAVHLRTHDFLPSRRSVDRFNSGLAVKVTGGVGTMWCAYVFAVIALLGLPAALQQTLAGGGFAPLPLVQWIAQTFLQLVLLSVIIVGQNVQAVAADARAARTLQDTEVIVDKVDENTQGGIRTVLDRLDVMEAQISALAAASRST